MAAGVGDPLHSWLERVHSVGVVLDDMASAALRTLPPEHAAEVLEYVAENFADLRNPSKYISSTISKGFKPRRSGGEPHGGFGGRISPEALEELQLRADKVGIVLRADAINALSGLPAEHADELIDFVIEKQGELRDPSNYIASTAARGYKSRRAGGFAPSAASPSFSSSAGPAGAARGAGPSGGAAAAGRRELEALRRRVEQAGVLLDALALQSLDSLPPEHAAEILEYVAENHGQLRNPSNYISSTVARGFVPRRGLQSAAAAPAAGFSINGAPAWAAGGGKGAASQPFGGFPGGKGGGGCGLGGVAPHASLVPSNATPLERRLHEVNTHHLPPAQHLDFASYLALRCVDERQSLELLESVRMKAGAISSPSNYVQAAVSKILNGHGFGHHHHDMPPPKLPRHW